MNVKRQKVETIKSLLNGQKSEDRLILIDEGNTISEELRRGRAVIRFVNFSKRR